MPEPHTGPQLEQHLPSSDCLLLNARTESSSLHISGTELFHTVHISCVPTGHLQETISSSLFLSLSFALPPSLQVSLNPMSKLAEATMLKSSREEPAHSTALLYVCRLLLFQGKSKGVFAFFFFFKSLIYLLLFLLLLLLLILYTESGHLGM